MEIKERWREHPLFQDGKIELVPTDWVWKYWGKDVSLCASLQGGTPIDIPGLWQNMLKEGMYEPLIIRVGLKNKKMRLESGNHRIQVFHKYEVEEVPVTVQVQEECGPHLEEVMTDATSNYDIDEELLINEITEEFMAPSEVFARFKKENGPS